MRMATVSPLEAIFNGALLFGVIVSAGMIGNAWGDLKAQQKAKKNGSRLIVARGNLRREGERMSIYVALLALGLFLAAQPPANPNRPITAGGIALTGCILFIVATMVAGGVQDRIERRRLINNEDAKDLIREAAGDADEVG